MLRLERTAAGEIIIMPPTGGETGHRNLQIGARLAQWAEKDGTGVGFDSSAGFVLPNGATRSPDAAWVRRGRLAGLTPEERGRFLPLAPDFVIELRSPSDRLADLQAKLEEYMANGVRLGWLLDPAEGTAYVFRPDTPPARLEHPGCLEGDPELPRFTLDLGDIWQPDW